MTDSIDKKELKKIRDELFKQQQDFSLKIRNTTDPNRPPYGGPSWSERKASIERRVAREKLKKKKGFMNGDLTWPEHLFGALVIAPIGWFFFGLYFIWYIRFFELFLSLPIPPFWAIVIWALACIGGCVVLWFLVEAISDVIKQLRENRDK